MTVNKPIKYNEESSIEEITLNLNSLPYTAGTYEFIYSTKDRFNQITTATRKVTFV